MASRVILESFRTSAGTLFQKERTPAGSIVYRKGGSFASPQSFHGARASIDLGTYESRGTAGVERGRVPRPEDFYQIDAAGRFRAGREGAALVGARPGQFISGDQLTEIRTQFARRANFESFMRQGRQRNMSRAEALRSYREFGRRMQEAAELGVDPAYILAAYWDAYEGEDA